MKKFLTLLLAIVCLLGCKQTKEKKAVYIIIDGVPADMVERLDLPAIREISSRGAYGRSYVGGTVGRYDQTPTISAVGYTDLLTSTWVNKHNVPGNSNLEPNYNYWTIFRIAKEQGRPVTTGLFSSWIDNRTVLIGIDGFGVYQALRSAGDVKPLFSANEGQNGVLHGNGVYDIIVDSWSNIVESSNSGGIDVARPVGSTTAVFRHFMNNPQSIINDHVNCVANWGNDLLLMGTDDGISIYNTATDLWKHTSRGMVVLDV